MFSTFISSRLPKHIAHHGLVEIAYVVNGSSHRSSKVYKLGLVPLVILVGMLAIGLYGGYIHVARRAMSAYGLPLSRTTHPYWQ